MLLRALAREFPKDSIEVVLTRAAVPDALLNISNLRVRTLESRLPHEAQRLYLEAWQVGALARDLRADVIWSLNVGPYVPTGIPHVLSVQNAFQVYPWRSFAPFHPQSVSVLAMLRWFFRRSLRLSRAVIVQTQLMRDHVAAIAGAPRDVAVIAKAVEDLTDVERPPLPRRVAEQLGLPRFRFLYVATAAPHKDHLTVIAAMDRLSRQGIAVQLVLTIEPGQALTIAGALARRLLATGELVCVSWIEKRLLRALYDVCDACVMPSLLESLSSCHLEAMAWSRPQVTCDLPHARDTCGDAALYAAPRDPVSWARQMAELSSNRSLQVELERRGKERMKRFPRCWAEAAREARNVLSRVAVQPGLAGSSDKRTTCKANRT